MNDLTDAPLAEKPEKMPAVGDMMHVPISSAGTEACIVSAVDPDGVVILKRPSGRHFVAYYGPLIGASLQLQRVRLDGSKAPKDERVWKFQLVERASW